MENQPQYASLYGALVSSYIRSFTTIDVTICLSSYNGCLGYDSRVSFHWWGLRCDSTMDWESHESYARGSTSALIWFVAVLFLKWISEGIIIKRERITDKETNDFEGFLSDVSISSHQTTTAPMEVYLKKPKSGWIKINIDAVVDVNSGCGIGKVSVGDDGSPCFIIARWIGGIPDADQDMEHLIMESDGWNLIAKINNDVHVCGQLGSVITRICACFERSLCRLLIFRKEPRELGSSSSCTAPT